MSANRYIRQETFEPLGPEGQRRIGAASAVIVGCGALGSNIANNLARAGIGRLRILDPDIVELDNLQRQVLFDESHVHRHLPKAVAAVEQLNRINSDVRLEGLTVRVLPHNVASLLAGFDVILDGTDNVETRLLLNDACLQARVPCVFGSAAGATGMVLAVVPDQTPCYRCFLRSIPEPGTTPNAASAGILNSTTAVVGALQSTLALRLLTGSFQPAGQVLCVDVWDPDFTTLTVPRLPDCPACVLRRFEFLHAPAQQP